MEDDPRQAELDAILADLDLSRDDAINDYRNMLDEAGREIHESIRRLERDARRAQQDPNAAERLAHDELVAEADRVGDRLREYLADLATLQWLGDASIEDASVGNIVVRTMESRLRIAIRGLRAATEKEPTDASPAPMRTARAAVAGALDVVERYVRAVAIRLGMPIVDPEGPN